MIIIIIRGRQYKTEREGDRNPISTSTIQSTELYRIETSTIPTQR